NVKFKTGLMMTVAGTLNSQGTAAQPILFTSFRDGAGAQPGDWKQLAFTSTSTGSVLDHVVVRYGGGYVDGEVEADRAAPTISNSTLSNSVSFSLRLKGSNATLTGDTFQNNDVPENGSGVGGAIRMDVSSQPVIHGITFSNNYVNGVWIDPGTLPAGTT